MIDHLVQMFVRFACDRCGTPQKRYTKNNLPLARETAEAEGFVIADWQYKGCPRQTCFCKACAGEVHHSEHPGR